jgi:hypothetical protein
MGRHTGRPTRPRPIKDVFDEMLKTEHAALMTEMFPERVKKNKDNLLGQAAHVYIASAARRMLSKAENEMNGVVNHRHLQPGPLQRPGGGHEYLPL